MSEILFPTHPAYRPKDYELIGKFDQLKSILLTKYHIEIDKVEPINKGMNTNYVLYVKGKPSLQLKILTRKGYPAIEKLLLVQSLIKQSDVKCITLTNCDSSDKIFPYGYIIQKWFPGSDGASLTRNQWIADFVDNLKKVHKIEMPYYGSLEEGPRFRSIREYYENIDLVIDKSFGSTLIGKQSIWDFHTNKLTTPDFIPRIFEHVYKLSKNLGEYTPHLVHGDMHEGNIMYTNKGTTLIDWDEAKSHFWPVEIARTLFFSQDKGILKEFIQLYNDKNTPVEEVATIIKLEHIRQHLRQLFMAGFDKCSEEEIRTNVKIVEKRLQILVKVMEI
ncbi:phosphotransferase [Alkalicella caledoniensis]|uniref:Phosphotransferase n=1 Tax=Alkalicella caledoniensis TaxID=2731377 RepID=A0A7G9W663_ALKCA|nr:phosphotransferase [Alkalicella caledoniensis]QNO14175.1 phosphotransferase [Alkalicella caledoniensis]